MENTLVKGSEFETLVYEILYHTLPFKIELYYAPDSFAACASCFFHDLIIEQIVNLRGAVFRFIGGHIVVCRIMQPDLFVFFQVLERGVYRL